MATTEPENTSTVTEETAPEPEVRDYVNPPDPAPEPEPVEAAEPTEPEEQEAAPEPPPLEPGDEDYSEKVQKRISKAIAKQREAERRAEYWERQAQQEQEQRKPAPAGHTPADDQAPREDTFESYEDYVRAVARYEARQEWQANERIREARTKQARVDAKMKVGLEKYPDFAEVVFDPTSRAALALHSLCSMPVTIPTARRILPITWLNTRTQQKKSPV